jgi:hypothetical protein
MRSTRSQRTSSAALAVSLAVGLVAAACGSTSSSQFNPKGGDGGSNAGEPFNGADLLDSGFSLDALAAADPPNQWCGPDGGAPTTPPIGGSLDCPTDKNLEGCPCGPVGTTAACWPGLRANRGIGDCKDGVATCQQTGEVGYTWGPCVGAVLPDPNAPSGPAACTCFSQGQWHIENLVPYFITFSDGKTFSLSTSQDPDAGTTVFPVVTSTEPEPPPMPTDPWSKDDLTVDCAGTFTLCYELKAGNYANPLPTDCSLTKVCLPSTYYSTADVKQEFPVLPSWYEDGTHTACANAFHETGGYGEMSVIGESVLCQHIDNGSGSSFVFHRIQYCGSTDTTCGQDGSGTFN